MAAFCACCGAEIKLKAEACAVCGTPFHGMIAAEPAVPLDARAGAEKAQDGRELPRGGSCKAC